MQMIIAPAKAMRVDTDSWPVASTPALNAEAATLFRSLQQLTLAEAQAVWRCSDRLAATNYARLHATHFDGPRTPAVIGYVGIQYHYMAPDLFTAPAMAYAQANLRILSGLYGVLRPLDGIVPYRLEMQSRLPDHPSLYAFWGARLHDALDWSAPVLNLASQEYAKALTPYLRPGERFIECVFGRLQGARVQVRATRAKIARGAMVRYLAERQVTTLAGVQAFDHPEYRFDPARSSDDRLVFLERT
ncbi:peroxide stress protein YaaA [Lacticaseibacillus absianus]|uniref:peroxide stress protein YaaA n=1 Tax=Lacticaseibacillus absianus TaxID=2729623 RepID=UPI0015CE76E3|nr:peroxide stress protein YaaA [Lacticaseibacillus absianus]